MTKHRAIANASRHDALLSTHGHPSSPRSRSQTAFHDKLNDAAGSDSSIEIFEGNLFAENSVKGTNLKETKPIHPFFLERRRREVPPITSARSKSDGKKGAKHDENLGTECVMLRANKVLQSSLNHTNTAGNDVSRRGVLQKEASGSVDKAEENKCETKAVTRSSGRAPKDRKGKAKSKVDVEANSSMPTYSFAEYCDPSPTVVYTRCEDEANTLVQTLESPLGFDLEWRVLWHSGAQERRTALVQLCDKSTVLLIQVSHMKRFPQKVWDLIESPSITKTGANILNDGEKLYRDFGIIAQGLVELGALAHFADDAFSSIYKRRVVSLAKMTAMYLKCNLVKSKERTSNWEGVLNNKMVHYAANDAHAALMVHLKLLESAEVGNKEIDPTKYTSSVDPHSVGNDKVISPHALPSPNAPNFPPEPPRPQYMRAYNLWHHRGMPLDRMCDTLKTGGRVEPLKESTVISYVVGAIQADTSLPFDMSKLLDLVRMEAGSWQRHQTWLVDAERSGRGRAVLLE
ncbi:ribonuclease H-like protein [Rhizopogon salebrosus TDB-379]|nr:ribonuclease H-like protein [Rhizopogon salebrosus TDB-379]